MKNDQAESRATRNLQRAIGLSLVLLTLALTGCSHLFSWAGAKPRKAEVKTNLFVTNASGERVSMDILQLKVMRFADDYSAMIAQASDDLYRRMGTPAVRLMTLKWKLGQSTAAFTDASGVNPVINALDMLVLVTVSRMVVEDYGIQTCGTNALPLLETHRQMEASAWDLAGLTLSATQKQEFQNMIQEWRNRNPNQRYVGSLRFVEFARALGKIPKTGTGSPNSIFSLLFIDPLAGMDPTAAALQETRELGERLMYYAQRTPALLAWQSEVVAFELVAQPESRQILTNSQQLACAAEAFAKAAGQLPQVINDQRQAAIDQVFNLLKSEEIKTRDLLAEARQTFAAGSATAQSINDAIKSLDEFVRYVSPPSTNQAAVSTNRQPFNVLDYGTAASQIGVAAKDLNTTLQTMNQTTPQLVDFSQQATANANRLVMRAFWLGLVLIVVLLGGSVVAALIYRKLTAPTDRPAKGRAKE